MVAAEEFLLGKVEETIELEMKGNPEFTPAQLAKKVLEAVNNNVDEMWLNGFSCIRPTGEFLQGIGSDILGISTIPGSTLVRITVN